MEHVLNFSNSPNNQILTWRRTNLAVNMTTCENALQRQWRIQGKYLILDAFCSADGWQWHRSSSKSVMMLWRRTQKWANYKIFELVTVLTTVASCHHFSRIYPNTFTFPFRVFQMGFAHISIIETTAFPFFRLVHFSLQKCGKDLNLELFDIWPILHEISVLKPKKVSLILLECFCAFHTLFFHFLVNVAKLLRVLGPFLLQKKCEFKNQRCFLWA